MISTYLENTLRTTESATVTEVFLWIIAGVFLFSLVMGALRRWKGLVAYTPNLLTSLGILGTFVGIVVGLMGFDPNDIDHSISLLLEGLKTAFITSLAGMGSSILFKFLSTTPLLARGKTARQGQDVGPALLEAMDRQNQGLDALRRAIAGEEESSLAGQLKLLRSDTNDHARETQRQLLSGNEQLVALREMAEAQRDHFERFSHDLWQHMERFGEMLSKSATEQVINALKEVVSDFNRNLTEQFGQNFQALDASVQRLVEWQENYRQQLAEMKEQYQQGVQAITITEASLAHISEESQKIPVVMDQLGQVVQVNQHQIEELDRHLDAFVQVRDKAVDAVPEIGKRIDEMTEGVAASTKTLVEGVQASGDHMKAAITVSAQEFEKNTQTLSASLVNMADHLVGQSEKIGSQLDDMANELNNNIRNMAGVLVDSYKQLNEQAVSMTQSAQQVGQQLQKDMAEIQKRVGDSLEQMQRRMESTIEEVMQAQTRETNRALEGVTAAVKTAVERTGDSVNTQMSAIDEAMQREIERVMNEMGQALARISGQFTQDYARLVGEMDRVVRQGARV